MGDFKTKHAERIINELKKVVGKRIKSIDLTNGLILGVGNVFLDVSQFVDRKKFKSVMIDSRTSAVPASLKDEFNDPTVSLSDYQKLLLKNSAKNVSDLNLDLMVIDENIRHYESEISSGKGSGTVATIVFTFVDPTPPKELEERKRRRAKPVDIIVTINAVNK